ncbi:hypothetical protein CEUSTIGMA_g4990.t1 [Chlamydomonas eustigma]|uniref:protein disulfide-isomerase n=1 Tax=Chlamydomonas eustigma TaxID=1157962 RepID=A0A250X3B9_9CHLO|nr:hypothetical protein CEUSTIGMA_g4990.t1 [Chlamydomonas eustigma]|eukprot:GAX77546.1 hypothetical protein CEUSTIGMA_g4990.t1 [Chlamydomonas eustigma]
MRITLLFLILTICKSYGSLYAKHDAVTQLTTSTFDDAIINFEGISVVEFYAPWCGHCQRLSPAYKTVAQKLKGIVTVAAVNCDDAQNTKLCTKQGVQGYPTLKLFSAEKMKNPYTGEFYKEAIDFPGSPTAKSIMEVCTSMLSSAYITRVRSIHDFEEFKAVRPEVAKVVLFTSKKETPTMYKSLSMQLHRGLDFAEVHESVEDVVLLHAVEQFPFLLVIKSDGNREAYKDELKAPQLREFLIGFSSVPPASWQQITGDDSKSASIQLKNLTLEDVELLDGKEDMVLLGFYSLAGSESSTCSNNVLAFDKAVLEMQAVVDTALVGVPPEKVNMVSRYGASPSSLASEPCSLQLVLMPFGEEKGDLDEYLLYKGPMEGKALQKWVTDAMPALPGEVTSESLQSFLDPTVGLARPSLDLEGDKATLEGQFDALIAVKILLFTNKEEAPGVFKALAVNFRHRGYGLNFGWAHSSQKELMKKHQVSKVPALVLIMLRPDQTEDGRLGYSVGSNQYPGPLKYTDMAKWLSSILDDLDESTGKVRGVDAAVSQGLIHEVIDDDSFEEHCESKGGICVLTLLDPSHTKTSQILKALTGLAIQRKEQPLSFCWVDGARFRPVTAAFGMIASDLPALVALSSKRMRFATLPKLSGDKEQLSIFIDGVLSGSIRTTVIQELPKVAESSAADAASGAEEILEPEELIEEEFDLSDILSEEVEAATSKEAKLKEIEEELKAEEEAAKAAAAQKAGSKKKSKKSKKSKSKGSKTEL